MEAPNRNTSGDDKDYYSRNYNRSLKVDPNSSPNIQNAALSIDALSPQMADLFKKNPNFNKKLQAALSEREFILVDKDYNTKIINYKNNPSKFLEENAVTVIPHNSDKQSWLKASDKEWKNLIDSVQNNFNGVIFSEDDFSKTYVCATAAKSEFIHSEISNFFDQRPSYIKISPHVKEFVRNNKKYSDLKPEETARGEIRIRSIGKPRLAELKKEVRDVISQSYFLDENRYELLCERKEKVFSDVEKKFQVKGDVFAADVPLVIEVNPMTSISCIVVAESQNPPVDNLIIVNEQKPSQEFNLVFDRNYYKVWKTVPWDIPTNQVVHAEISPTYTRDKLKLLFEDCLRSIYLSQVPVKVLGIKPCFKGMDWKHFLSCWVSTVEYLREEQMKIPHHYIMLIAENDEILAQIKPIFEGQNELKGQKELNVTVIEGNLTEQNVDIIVNSSNCILDLNYGGTSKALLKKAGKELQRECRKKYPYGINELECAMTFGHNLPCKYVLHGVLPPKYEKSMISILVSRCLEMAAVYKVSSIAFPALGTGRLNFPPDKVAEEMNEGFKMFSKKIPIHSIKEIRIVVFPGQPEIKKSLSKIMTTASVDIPSSPSSTPEEKWLKNCQHKLLRWILFVNYSGEPKNLILGEKSFLMDLEKVPFMIHSDQLEELIFFTNIFSLVPDIVTQYSEKKRGEVELFVPRDNLMKLKVSLSKITNKLTSETLKVNVKLTGKQVDILLQKIQQKYPQMRCEVANNGQDFSFRSLDWSMNQEAKYQFESFLGLRENVPLTPNQFNENKPNPERMEAEFATASSSYLEPKGVKHEFATASSSYLEPKAVKHEFATASSSYLEPKGVKHEFATASSSYLEPKGVKHEFATASSSYLEPKAVKHEFATASSSYLEPKGVKHEFATASSSYLEPKGVKHEFATASSSYLEPKGVKHEFATASSSYLEPKAVKPKSTTVPPVSFETSQIKTFVSNSQKNEDINCFQIGGGLFVKVYEGNILNVNVDGIVNNTATGLIYKYTGDAVVREGESKLKGQPLNYREVLSTSAGNLDRYKNIIHIVLPMFSSSKPKDYYLNTIAHTMDNCLKEAALLGLNSVALPIISSEIPLDIFINGYFLGVKEFSNQKAPNYRLEVHFVDPNPAACRAIKDYFAKQMQETPSGITRNNIQQSEGNSVNLPNQGKPEDMDVDDENVSCFGCKKPVDNSKNQKKCKLIFCNNCIENQYCLCNKPVDPVYGKHPGGTMCFSERTSSNNKKFYEIEYHIPSSYKEHHYINGTSQVAYLPATEEGKTTLKMLQLAFERYLIFTVKEKAVSFGDIPHILNKDGCLAPEYFNNVKICLAEKGIYPENVAERVIHKKIPLK